MNPNEIANIVSSILEKRERGFDLDLRGKPGDWYFVHCLQRYIAIDEKLRNEFQPLFDAVGPFHLKVEEKKPFANFPRWAILTMENRFIKIKFSSEGIVEAVIPSQD